MYLILYYETIGEYTLSDETSEFFLGQIPEKHVFLCTFLDFVTLSPFENMYIILACLLAVYPLDGILKMDFSLEFTHI